MQLLTSLVCVFLSWQLLCSRLSLHFYPFLHSLCGAIPCTSVLAEKVCFVLNKLGDSVCDKGHAEWSSVCEWASVM